MTARAARVSLRAPLQPFRSEAGRTQLVTFPELEGPEPVVRAVGPTGARVIVVVWPSDPRGLVLVDEVRRGGARLTTWDLSPAEVAALSELVTAGWRFDTDDLLVSGGPDRPDLAPSARTLRKSEWCPTVSDADVARLTNH